MLHFLVQNFFGQTVPSNSGFDGIGSEALLRERAAIERKYESTSEQLACGIMAVWVISLPSVKYEV